MNINVETPNNTPNTNATATKSDSLTNSNGNDGANKLSNVVSGSVQYVSPISNGSEIDDDLFSYDLQFSDENFAEASISEGSLN